jgi:TIR domain
MAAAVFISHSSRDRKVAQTLCQALEERGLSCWISSRDIGPGENFQEAIVKALRGARAMVLVFTNNANNSDEIKKEMALASQNHLAVIPVRVEDVMPNDAFAYEFATRQWVDVFDDWERSLGRLADHVRQSMGEQEGEAARIIPGPPRKRRIRPALAAAIVVLVLAAAAGGGYYWLNAAGAPDLTGEWVTTPLPNPYDANQKSILHFDLHQRGETLFGTVTEEVVGHGGDKKGLQAGQVKGGTVSFFTMGLTTGDNGAEHPYKEIYHGVVKPAEIDFIRQNDVPSGGIPEKFIATRK